MQTYLYLFKALSGAGTGAGSGAGAGSSGGGGEGEGGGGDGGGAGGGAGEDELKAWEDYVVELQQGGHFVGGGPLGKGQTRKGREVSEEVSETIAGFMVVTAETLEQATALLEGCPAIVAGAAVEVRHVPEV